MSLKQKTASGIIWSSVDNLSKQGIVFVVGIILARMLEPKEFGLVGMITIFIAVSESFIKCGFNEALIRKKNCTETDYSTVFFYNLSAGILLFCLLFVASPGISNFFDEPKLKKIIRVLSIVLIIDSVTLIQYTILNKRVDFKLLTRISLISSIGSGLFAIILAFKGYGVWSLVALRVTKVALNSLFLWLWNQWRPVLRFSKRSFSELFGFGSKLLLSGLIDTVYNNVYYLIIGKYFSASELGFYTRAKGFSDFPSQNINFIMNRVTYPVLAVIQDNSPLLRESYRKIIRGTMLITFVLILGIAAVAEPLVITLIGEKWKPSIIYLQMLCFAGMLYPLQSLNLNILKVLGRSDLFLKLEIIKKTLAVPVIFIGVFFGIKFMIIGMIFNSFVAYYLNSYWSGKFIGYSMKSQVKDITPSFLLAAGMAIIVFTMGYFLKTSYLTTLILQLILGTALVFGFCELTKMTDYVYMKQIVVEKISKRKEL